MDNFAFLLEPPAHRDHRGRHYLPPVNVEAVGPKDAISDAGLILDRYEQDALGRAGALTNEDHPGDLDIAAIPDMGEIRAADDAHATKLFAQEAQRMRAQRKLQRSIILDDLTPFRHRP